MAERRLDAVALTVDGRPLPAERYDTLTMVRVEESVHLPDAFTLRFDDPHFALLDEGTFAVGTRVEVAFQAEGELVTVTSGEITALTVEEGATGRHELVLTGFDAAHRLAHGAKARTFLQMTDADVVAKVAEEHGLDAEVAASGEVHDYVLQANETDYAFLTRLARRAGLDWWVTDRTVHLAPRPHAEGAPPVLTWGANLQRFTVRLSAAERCDEVSVRGWDPLAKQPILGRATEGDRGTTAPAAQEQAAAARDAFGAVRRVAGQHPVATQAEADALADALLQRAAGEEVRVRGEAHGDPLLAAGSEVAIDGVGERLSGTYRVTAVEHVYGTGSPYLTRFVCGGREASGLADLVAAGPRRDAQPWGGLAVGIVTNCDDPERLGRVRVKLPTLTAADESAWARVASPGAGPARGFQCLPEVGDEVLVGFEQHDLRRPIVIGGLWNREDPLPDPDAVVGGEVAARTWRSRDGHRLTFRDEGGGRAELALSGAPPELVLDAAESTLAGDRVLRVAAQELHLHADRKLTLEAPQVEIAGTSEVTVTGGVIRLN